MADCVLCGLPAVNDLADANQPMHRVCALRSVLGGVGHLLDHERWCDERHDTDAGLDLYTSALLVDVLVQRMGVEWVVSRPGRLPFLTDSTNKGERVHIDPNQHFRNDDDVDGNPAGGVAIGTGYSIEWQSGPLVDPETGDRKELSGAFVEHVLEAVIQRVRYYQQAADGRFACRENALAITHMEEALHWMHHRTADREARGVEGTHQS